MANSSSSSSGVGFFGLLTISFIVMKLCKVITWSWVWVVSPIWIYIIIVLLILAVALLIPYIDDKMYDRRLKKRREKSATLTDKPKKKLSFAGKMEEMMQLQKEKRNTKP